MYPTKEEQVKKLVFDRMRPETRKQKFFRQLLYDITVWYDLYNYRVCLERDEEREKKFMKDANEAFDSYISTIKALETKQAEVDRHGPSWRMFFFILLVLMNIYYS